MGNFIRNPNIIFAKFPSCKKALNLLFNSLVLMEKDLVARFLKSPGGYPENGLFFFPFLSSSSARRQRRALAASTPRRATSRPPRAWIRAEAPCSLLSLALFPLACSSLSLVPRIRNPSSRSQARRRRHTASPASLRPPPGSPSPPLFPRARSGRRDPSEAPNCAAVSISGRRHPCSIPPPSGRASPRRPPHRLPLALVSSPMSSVCSLPLCLAPPPRTSSRRRANGCRRQLG